VRIGGESELIVCIDLRSLLEERDAGA